MTCEELHWYFEDHLRDAEVRSARGAIADHVATCADCRRFVSEQRELGKSLRQVRESTGPVPRSLDGSVLLNYRRHMSEQRVPQQAMGRRFHPRLVWAFSALAAGIVVVAVLSARSRHETNNAVVHPASTQIVTIPVPTAAFPDVQRPRKRKNVAAKRVVPAAAPVRTASLPVRTVRSLPEGFRSLMYCDELSCPQDMEMIRVQLPSSAMPRQVSTYLQTSGSVTADVLVGADGIARGIRFEEIEF